MFDQQTPPSVQPKPLAPAPLSVSPPLAAQPAQQEDAGPRPPWDNGPRPTAAPQKDPEGAKSAPGDAPVVSVATPAARVQVSDPASMPVVESVTPPPRAGLARQRPKGAGAIPRVPGRMVVMPQSFLVPPKRPTRTSRVVVVTFIALLVAGIMWAGGIFISQTIDAPFPFFAAKRKKSPVQPPAPPIDVNAPLPAPPAVPVPALPPSDSPSNAGSGTGSGGQASEPSVTAPAPSVLPLTAPTPTPAPPSQTPGETPSAVQAVVRVASAADADSDGLTDEEEKLYLTDPTKSDTDGDGFTDGAEVKNLYDPLKGGGARLANGGTVNQYINPTLKYTVLAPKSWVVKPTDNTAQEVLFTSATGEFVSILVQNNRSGLSVQQWYKQQNPAADPGALVDFTTLQQLNGVESPDGLTSYLAVGNHVFVFSYNIGIRTDANFLTTVTMMRNSFTPSVQ